MQVYKAETEEIIRRFRARRISFPDCIAALDAALAGFIPSLEGCQIPELRAIMLENNDAVMSEMARRSVLAANPDYSEQLLKRKPLSKSIKSLNRLILTQPR